MANNDIKKLRTQRKAIDDKIAETKVLRRKAEDDAAKSKHSEEITKLRAERKGFGEALRAARAKATANS